MLAKVVTWGTSREVAIRRMRRALGETRIAGPELATTLPFLQQVLDDPEFVAALHSTALLERIGERKLAQIIAP